MSSVKEGVETVTESGPSKRRMSSESVSTAKRVHLDEYKGIGDDDDAFNGAVEVMKEDQQVKVVTEADVGISAYVKDSLVPIKGGIIKHRFSDFHVREVSIDGSVCHITSFYPPTKEQGGSGLYEFMKQQEAEMEDETGTLLKERREKQAADKAEKEHAMQKEVERKWVWEVDQSKTTEMTELLGEEALEKVRTLWEQGPHGFKVEDNAVKEEDQVEADSSSVQENNNDGSTRGGRSDRGGRGNGRGRGRGRGGARMGNDKRQSLDPRFVMSQALESKEERTAVHRLIRETFEGNLATDTVETPSPEDETIKISTIRIRWISKDPSRMRFDRRQGQREDEPPPYIHFLLQKTNRESQDALNIVAKSLGLLHPGTGTSKALRDLSVAGTKDKRAVTVQKVAFKRGRREIDDVWKMLNGVGKSLDSNIRGARGRGGFQSRGGKIKSALDAVRGRGDRGIRVGHLEYAHEPLHLGMLQGNEFVIVLRNVQVEDGALVVEAINILREKGFINYYGMQRFGTSVISTHTVGIALFQNNFQEAVRLIMAPRPGDSDEVEEARQAFLDGDVEKALKMMPHYNIPERSILQRMQADKDGQNDWKGYFQAIPRGLRTMYVHAYQSYIWNRMVTERVKRFGLFEPVLGDIVYTGEAEGKDAATDLADNEEGNNDEDVQLEGRKDGSQPKQVKILMREEDLQQYSIHDIVMPLPGNEIQMSENGWMAQAYREMLAEDNLTPKDIGNSNVPEFALKGDYRKVLHLPKNVSYKLLRYRHANANLCQSDEDAVLGIDAPNAEEYNEGDKPLEEDESIAMLLRLTLGVSAYATMALREVLKQDTSVAHQKELTEKSDQKRARSPPYRNQAVNKIQGKQLRTWGPPKEDLAAQQGNIEEGDAKAGEQIIKQN